MKKLINSLIVVFVIVLMSICILTGYSSEGTIKIGFAGPLTGGSAEHGTRQVLGATMAIEEVNEAGGINGKMLELVKMDDRADPKEAATIANRFGSDEDILVVLGHANSSCTLAGAPIYNNAGLVHMTTTSSAPSISDAGPYTYRLWVTDNYRAKYDIGAMVEAGYDNIAIIFENNDYGRGGYNAARNALNDLGLEPLVAETYLLGETKDFTTLITKLQNMGAEAVYAISDETEIAMFLMQSKQFDYNPFYVSAGTYNPAVIRIGQEAVEGAIGTAMAFVLDQDPSAEINLWWENFYNRFPNDNYKCLFAPVAYEAVSMMIKAIEERGEDREAIKNYLDDVKSRKGLIGEVSFDENGDAFLPLVHVMVEDGDFVPWSPQIHKR